MGFKRVLVATDFSPGAIVAARAGLALAAADAAFEAFHVLPHQRPPIPPRVLSEDQEQLLEDSWDRRAQDAHDALYKFVNEASIRGASTQVVYGSVEAAATKLAQAYHPDLVVLGACSGTAGTHLTAGSNARALLRALPSSVLVARPYADTTPNGLPARVAVATDFLDDAAAACRFARELRERGSTHVDIVHVLDPSNWFNEFKTANVRPPPPEVTTWEGIQRAYRGFLHDANHKFFGGQAQEHFLFGKPAPTLIGFLKQHDVGLALLGSRGEHGIEGIEIGSVAADVAERGSCSVLVCRSSP